MKSEKEIKNLLRVLKEIIKEIPGDEFDSRPIQVFTLEWVLGMKKIVEK